MSEFINYYSHNHPLVGLRSRFACEARDWMFARFMATMQPTPESKVLDLGVTPDKSLPESNFFERLYPHKERITAASIEDAAFLEQEYPGLKFVPLNAGALPFADNEFDIIFCSAVIEHVGDRAAQEQFLKEALRVTKQFFFTTPNRWYPMEFHTFLPLLHWLPQPLHQKLLRWIGKDFWASTDNLNLLSVEDFVRLFPKVTSLHVDTYRLFGLPSNIIIHGTK